MLSQVQDEWRRGKCHVSRNRVSGRIGRPVAEVFDAVVNPKKLSSYFTTIGGASAPLVKGTTVTWWKEAPVEVVELVPESRIVLRWDGGMAKTRRSTRRRVEMNFKPLEDGGTLVTIAETGWREDDGRRGTPISTAKAGRRCFAA